MCFIEQNRSERYEFGDNLEDYHPYFTQDGEDRDGNPNQYIANMTSGSVAGFKYFDIKEINEISLAARGKGRGIIKVSTSLEETDVAGVNINLDDEVNWHTLTSEIQVEQGRAALYFRYEGNRAIDFLSFELI